MLGEDDGDDGGEVVAVVETAAAAASFMGLLIVEITFPSTIVLVCSVTIVVDRPSGYPPSAGTTCVASVRAYSRTDMVPNEIDLDEDDEDDVDGLDLLLIGVDGCCIIDDDGDDDGIDSVPL